MGGPSWFDLACWVGAALVAILAFVLIGLFVRGDRARGRRRCGRCWYDMSSSAGLKCPECGHVAKSEVALHKTRRRRSSVGLALTLIVAAGALAVWPQVRRSGWMSLVPTAVLAEILPIVGTTSEPRAELERRLGMSAWPDGASRVTVTEAELVSVIRCIARGNVFARPCDERWEASYGAICNSLNQRAWVISNAPTTLTLGQSTFGPAAITAFDELFALPIEITLEARPRVPLGMSVPIRARIKHRFPPWYMDDMKLDWKLDEASPLTPQGFRTYCTLKIPGEGKKLLQGTLTTFAESHLDRSKREVDVRPVRLTFELGGTVDDVLTPVRSPDLDKLLASTVLIDVHEWGVSIWPGAAADPAFDDCAFGLKFTLYDGETKLLTAYSRWIGLKGKYGGDATCGNTTSFVPGKQLKELLENVDKHPLELRVESHPDSAIEHLEATRYWSGSFTVPVNKGPQRR